MVYKKTFAAIWFGRDTFVRFSQAVSLRYMVVEHGSDEKIAQKLARVAKCTSQNNVFQQQVLVYQIVKQCLINYCNQKQSDEQLKMKQNQKNISIEKSTKKKHIKFWMKLQLMSAIQVYVQ